MQYSIKSGTMEHFYFEVHKLDSKCYIDIGPTVFFEAFPGLVAICFCKMSFSSYKILLGVRSMQRAKVQIYFRIDQVIS